LVSARAGAWVCTCVRACVRWCGDMPARAGGAHARTAIAGATAIRAPGEYSRLPMGSSRLRLSHCSAKAGVPSARAA
jgi:hypothetical protein